MPFYIQSWLEGKASSTKDTLYNCERAASVTNQAQWAKGYKLNGPEETMCISQCPWEIEGFYLKHVWFETPSVSWIKKSIHIKKKKKVPICKGVTFQGNYVFYNPYTAWILENSPCVFRVLFIPYHEQTHLIGATVLKRSQGFHSCMYYHSDRIGS